jgi:hypothetical protein
MVDHCIAIASVQPSVYVFFMLSGFASYFASNLSTIVDVFSSLISFFPASNLMITMRCCPRVNLR